MRLLELLRQHLREQPGKPLPTELATELLKAFDAIAAGIDIERALVGADRRKGRSALVRAGELLGPDAGAYRRAELIEATLKRLNPKKPRTDVDRVLVEAVRAWPTMPRSARRIFDAIRDGDATDAIALTSSVTRLQ